ncbi:hypothetical protein [Fibrobacter sp. UWH3]
MVGKNGSGKSTLMDLMYMAINNFCYMFERGHKRERPGADELYYVPGLFLKLYFQLNKNSYELKSRYALVELQDKTENTTIFEATLDNIGNEKPLAKQRFNDSEISSIVDNFFYTIVSNYSMQSFVDDNYKRQIYFYADKDDINRIEQKKEFIDHDCKAAYPHSWISPIFHKNDGYIRSLVLNPYRHNGNINLSNEFKLSKERVASLFISIDTIDIPKRYFFRPYKFSHLEIKLNAKKFQYYLDDFLREFENINNPRPIPKESLILDFLRKTNDDFGLAIQNIFKLPNLQTEEIKLNDYEKFENFCYCVAYIKLKLYKITKKYDAYKDFKEVLNLHYGENFVQIEGAASQINDLLQFVLKDPSHITKKIRRLVNFLCLAKGTYLKKITKKNFTQYFNEKSVFYNADGKTDEEPIEHRPQTADDYLSPQIYDDCLPPALFDWELYLNKIDKNENIITDEMGNPIEIPYNQMSSGEVQFLQTFSIHAYHLMNLVSISNKSGRPKYNNFNLVFDEVEICMHPEMQRVFIKKIIDLLVDLETGNNNSYNIFIITHSPFILSDIPTENILYLEDGCAIEEKRRKPTFAQNIGDMMYSSFFMEKTIGEFAEEKLKELIRKRQGKKTHMSDQEADAILKSIGDPVIRSLIEEIEANDD